MASIIGSDVTYSSLILNAASTLAAAISSSSVDAGTFKQSNTTITINGKKSNITLTDKRTEAYSAPSASTIANDLISFLSGVGIPTSDTIPSTAGLMSFFFALNFFMEKAIIKRAIESNPTTYYHVHYSPPSASSYASSKLPISYSNDDNLVTENKINDIYKHLSSVDMTAPEIRNVGLSSSHQSCSSSSSSCSSLFIAYFNLK